MYYFAQVAEIFGCSNQELSVEPGIFLNDLIEQLNHERPMLAKQPYQVAVNQSLVKSNPQLNEGDEIALLPPFAGG
jgi:molybdopterin converting factor subunit 1